MVAVTRPFLSYLPPERCMMLQVDDRGLYAPGQLFLNRRHVIGKATAFLPRVGIVTIIMNDYPYVKYVLIGVLCIFVLTSRE